MLSEENQIMFRKHMPHGDGIICIDRVLNVQSDSVVCQAEVGSTKSTLVGDLVSSTASLELIAQAALAGRISKKLELAGDFLGAEIGGSIIRLTSMNLFQEYWPKGWVLKVCASWSQTVSGAFQVSGGVSLAKSGLKLANAELTILESI